MGITQHPLHLDADSPVKGPIEPYEQLIATLKNSCEVDPKVVCAKWYFTE